LRGVITTKPAGHVVRARSSSTVFSETPVSEWAFLDEGHECLLEHFGPVHRFSFRDLQAIPVVLQLVRPASLGHANDK
jgi:hypothetical protein